MSTPASPSAECGSCYYKLSLCSHFIVSAHINLNFPSISCFSAVTIFLVSTKLVCTLNFELNVLKITENRLFFFFFLYLLKSQHKEKFAIFQIKKIAGRRTVDEPYYLKILFLDWKIKRITMRHLLHQNAIANFIVIQVNEATKMSVSLAL